MGTWKLEDAKNQFSKLVREARQKGPQIVTRHGQEEVVVIAVEEYRRLARRSGSFVAFMRKSPLAKALAAGEIELTRTRDLPRDISL
ncbi:MAG: type II toxin-antitoxin system prevent-host-death family antitoxin [Gemmatimonadota bacterium]